MVLILEFLLADVAQDDAVAAALPATLRLLRRRRPVEVASTPVRSRWCGRLTELLRSDCASARHAGIALVVETATQLDEAAFAAHREPWAVTLLSLSTQRSGGDAIRSASAAALTELLAVASRWPVQRRDAAVHAPRLLGALLSMAERPSASATADADVGGCSVEAEVVTSTLKLARVAPHCVRAQRSRLASAATQILLQPTGGAGAAAEARAAAAAAELLGALPAVCGGGAAFAQAWGETVASLSGTLHALLRTALGSLTAQPLCSAPPPAAALPSPGAEAEALLAAATGCVRALHSCLCPPGAAGAAADAPPAGDKGPCPVQLPLGSLCTLALSVLSLDGVLQLPAPEAGALKHASAVALLPELHVLALQLLHSLLLAARRRATAPRPRLAPLPQQARALPPRPSA